MARNHDEDGRSKNALSRWVVERIVKLDEEGLTRVEIEERLGVCDETIRKYLRQAGRPIHFIGRAVEKARKERRVK